MLLVVDVGNSNTVLGIYRGEELLCHWRVTTDRSRTVDEYAILLHQLFQRAGVRLADIRGVIISSVVPPMIRILEGVCRSCFDLAPRVVGPGTETGMPILYDNPREVGADRIVNAVAAYEKKRQALIVIDFGTATTFDYISAKGEYLGGAISPGLGISAEALFERASRLPRVEFARPPRVIARNTEYSMQSGLFHGYVGLVDGVVCRMKQEAGEEPLVIATGGLAGQIAEASQTIDEVDPLLTLEGLRIIHARNAAAA